ncbi:MAG: hypothetical protein JWQ46_826 [Phenylobacterium sp.]|nr:hypothetical protein [Phenylobacterium sp.]
MAGLRAALSMALGISATVLLVSSCDNGPSAVAGKQAAGTQMATNDAPRDVAGGASTGAPGVDHRKDPVQMLDGKPVWAASRRYSADESAQHAFERNGETFGARSLDQYGKKAHAFVEHPPAGAQTLTRANGDMLFYDPKGHVFAVANKDGAPRTMFKPDDGASYWQVQKDREAKRQTASAGRRTHKADDEA